jgi:glycosyltransferase involved in cell wall biosynthesis
MGRELPRTLLSLSPGYQRGCSAGDYEIVVVDNGSTEPPGAQDFAHLGGSVRVLHCTQPTPSPALAVNEGLAAARGELIGVWIDGARLASPGLIAACRTASTLHPRAVIATINYQLGPQLQFLAAEEGYDQREEDRLLASIEWPSDGYRLFEIATSELRAGLEGPMLESNALFLSRALWDELGGYDEQFAEPGGGVVNPDTFIRASALPDSQLIRIAGEGTFHQIHGGLSTSTTRRAMDTLRLGSRAYFRRRGRPLTPVRATGWIFDAREDRLVG